MNKISGSARRKLKHILRALKKQNERLEGLSEVDKIRMRDIETALNQKIS